MEVRSEVVDAISHAVRAVELRRVGETVRGLDAVAERHSRASKAALARMLAGEAVEASPRSR